MKDDEVEQLIGEALAVTAGPAVLLDEHLKVRFASESAHEILGTALPLGASAPALLCGDRPKRPVAEALAAGQPIQAIIPRPDLSTANVLIRSIPLRRGRKKIGWMLLVAPAVEGPEGPGLFHGMWS